MRRPSMTDDQLMERVMEEARRIAADLVERRVKGIQRVIARKDREISELRARLAEQEDTGND